VLLFVVGMIIKALNKKGAIHKRRPQSGGLVQWCS